tara:strand:+ start:8387 stop:9031 length:645 start_codon:yes stop_codon:yes gene_type:complete
MKSTEMLNKIKTLLDIQIKLEEQSLENGTKIEAESFEKGKEVFIMSDDERVAMPVGEYILEDGRLLVVEQEGLIADMREVSDEVPAKEEEGKEITEDMKDDDEYEEDGKEADVADWKGMEKRIQNLEDAISDLKGDKESKMEDVEEQEMADDSSGVLKSRTVKEEFKKEELSIPSVEPIKHSPESKKSKNQKGFLHSQNRIGNTLDRVLSRLNK